MNGLMAEKITASHLKRDAYLYIRQSTLRQVLENTESTRRQYELQHRAVALGWPAERVVVIDSDLGQSGASATDRKGFQKLVTEVSLGRAGLVMGLEVSRLARNCSDWHRLLEICALGDTLILDEDGLYNPVDFNDRLLLGLKGTMSEAELHVLKARLRGGILNKARRGELRTPLPVGLVYNSKNQVELDPDQQVQKSLRLFFETFRRTGSATTTVKAFREQGLLFPRRLCRGLRKGELLWGRLDHWRALQLLHNPRYGGAFFFGRTRQRKRADGSVFCRKLPPDQWSALFPHSHPGYISWQEYQENQRRLRENRQSWGQERRKSPPREGTALLQGLALCGLCGQRMTVRYHQRGTRVVPDYLCQRQGIAQALPICQHIPGASIDEAISRLVVQRMTPLSLEVALAVQEELRSRSQQADRLRRQQVERARYEAELAQRRYLRVDPDHRLVADSLEADWNLKLRDLREAQEEYQRQRDSDQLLLDEQKRVAILTLSRDFPKVWNNPRTSQRERKRLLRLLVQDVTLVKSDQLKVQVRFRGGATQTLTLPLPKDAGQLRKTSPEVIKRIDQLLDRSTEAQIADILNEESLRTGEGRAFDLLAVQRVRLTYQLKSRYDRLRKAGLLTLSEMAALLGVFPCTVKRWRRNGLVKGRSFNEKYQCLYEHPGDSPPRAIQGKKLASRQLYPRVVSDAPQEVQCEA